jgi:hypothetical protein
MIFPQPASPEYMGIPSNNSRFEEHVLEGIIRTLTETSCFKRVRDMSVLTSASQPAKQIAKYLNINMKRD